MFEKYRLGLDMGSSSLGWAMILLGEDNEPIGVKRLGVRIFSDGRDSKSEKPLSVSRRESRGARRNHDRYIARLRKLLSILVENGFIPNSEDEKKELFAKDPYELRSRALDERLSKGEIGRALFHLAKRRGFLSNRKTDSEESQSKFKTAIQNLKEALESQGARSLGEYLYTKSQDYTDGRKRQSLRFKYKDTTAEELPIFPQRDMLIDEFEQIWEKQKSYYPEFKASLKEEIYQAIFFQNPLKPTLKGKCIFEKDEDRAAKAHPLFQEFRILQEVNNILIEDLEYHETLPLSPEQRQIIVNMLKEKESVNFSSMRSKLFKKEKDNYRFNLETESRNKLQGDLTATKFLEKPQLKTLWQSLSTEEQYELVELLISDKDEKELLNELMTKYNCDFETAKMLSILRLPANYGNLSLKAIKKIIPSLRIGKKYYEACADAGYNHSETYNGIVYQDGDLPYYGELLRKSALPLARSSFDADADEYGKINNPTVHIALNQARKLINALVKLYGPPAQIVLELARELKMGKDEKEELIRKQNKNRKANERIVSELSALNIPDNYENRTRYKLWEELSADPLERRCIYSGRLISIEKLFSPEFEIEHILPKSRTYDDSISNKTISYYMANRYKGERSPYEAFGDSRDGYDWEAIVQRASALPQNKWRRFFKDAMQRFKDEEKVLARMLNDTRYMSRVAREYLQYVVGDRNIWVVTGQQTALFRAKWGFNRILQEDDLEIKNRDDHRHHAIDAFVIGMMSRSLIQRFSCAVRRSQDRFLEDIGDPFPGFNHHSFREQVLSINVSIKPNQINASRLRKRNQTAGLLLKETAYGYFGPDPQNPSYHLYTERKEIQGISLKDIDRIVDPYFKRMLQGIKETSNNKKAFKQALAEWAKNYNVKKLKLYVKAKPATMIGIKDRDGNICKYYAAGENLYMDIFTKKPWDPQAPWEAEIINSFNAHQPDFVPQWKKENPMAKLIMRLYKDDIVALDTDSGRELRRMKKMSNNIAYLRVLHIARKADDQNDIGEQFSARQLKRLNARKAGVDIIGRAFDPYWEGKNASIGDNKEQDNS